MPLVKSKAANLLKSKVQFFSYDQKFGLEGGGILPELTIAYTTHGVLNAEKDNVVWIFHALTANADPTEWWPGLVGINAVINPDKYFIVCANMLGSCYGSTGPESLNPATGEKYGQDFPLITVKDMVKGHKLLRKYLGIDNILFGIGGSMGGQQLLEWSITNPVIFKNICLIATNAHHSAWGIAFNSSQRLALEADPTLNYKYEGAGENGLRAARAIALLSYRNQNIYRKTQSDFDDKLDDFKADTYQKYQGDKLTKRFSPQAYWTLSKAMDSHNIGRGRQSGRNALKTITASALIIGIKSDLLFPFAEQRFIAQNIKDADFKIIDSLYGHDGFLLETEVIGQLIRNHLNKTNEKI
jgi:homoserine O-acetyltransferase/O-succinyltransferase